MPGHAVEGDPVSGRTRVRGGKGIVGKGQDGFILTLVERCSRLLVAATLRTRRAHEACQAVIDALLDFPISWVRSITFDNGSEFADHQHIAAELGINVYFADPYSSYQRGSNEQVNAPDPAPASAPAPEDSRVEAYLGALFAA